MGKYKVPRCLVYVEEGCEWVRVCEQKLCVCCLLPVVNELLQPTFVSEYSVFGWPGFAIENICENRDDTSGDKVFEDF
jgi:hypothetical protein